ncbi:probable serine hydrolase isoform X1 [Drosophila takahashii]|uniref:probable serine hydrolase isoform X1 n=1 Tax=Drosophila takahashii TaxID=29030 RepID=UPI001CF8976D|nr:probable serine hydrolase isoform X1 [Drosophila takahashii]
MNCTYHAPNYIRLQYEDVTIPAPWGFISGRWYGNRTERPILAIHGWLDNLGTYDRLIPMLPDYIGVLCIDLPGHGRSSRLPSGIHYNVYDYVFIIPRVMKEFGWSKVSLMGHSLGGVMSFMYAAMAPGSVDMIISLDVLLPRRVEDPSKLTKDIEGYLIEEKRQADGTEHEPPSFTLSSMRKVLARNSNNSVPEDMANHMLHRQVAKSQMYPEKVFFSRDNRVKFYHIFDIEEGLAAEMARRIKKKPYLVIKGGLSPFVGPRCDETMSILSEDNPHFEFYEVKGAKHHVHLQAAEECARYIVPFIRNHRPSKISKL